MPSGRLSWPLYLSKTFSTIVFAIVIKGKLLWLADGFQIQMGPKPIQFCQEVVPIVA
jgi:hypothetical protein